MSISDLEMLDIYEGCPQYFYERIEVVAKSMHNNSDVTAFVYIKGSKLEGVLDDSEWSYDEFCEKHL